MGLTELVLGILPNKFVLRQYLRAGIAYADACSYAGHGADTDMLRENYSMWSSEYSRRGNQLIHFDDFHEFSTLGKMYAFLRGDLQRAPKAKERKPTAKEITRRERAMLKAGWVEEGVLTRDGFVGSGVYTRPHPSRI